MTSGFRRVPEEIPDQCKKSYSLHESGNKTVCPSVCTIFIFIFYFKNAKLCY